MGVTAEVVAAEVVDEAKTTTVATGVKTLRGATPMVQAKELRQRDSKRKSCGRRITLEADD